MSNIITLSFAFLISVALLALGFVIYKSNSKNFTNKSFFIFTATFGLWLLFNFFEGWFENLELVSFFFLADFVFGPFVIFSSFVFLLNFPFQVFKNVYFYVLAMFPALAASILVLLGKVFGKTVFNKGEIQFEMAEYYYLYAAIIVLYAIISFAFLMYRYFHSDNEEREKINYVASGFLLAIMITVIFNLFLQNRVSKEFFHLSSYSPVILIVLTAYAMAKHKAFNAKLITTQILTATIWLLIFSQFIFAKEVASYIIITLTLTLAIFFGLELIASVKKEIERKEELQLLTDKLAAANEELKRLDNAKSEFISIASHQLRTPLTAIKGFVSLVLEGSYGDINPRVRDALTKVYASGERLIHLVEDLLNVSRIESGRMEFKMEKTKIEDMLHELYDTFVLIARDKKLTLDLKLPKRALSQVSIDSGKMREVLSNLIDNALKYTEKGGVIVKAEMIISEGKTNLAKESNIAAQSKVNLKGKKVVRVTVSDTGIGIPDTEMPYMFGKFSRGKDTSRLHVGGTGLGLYVGKSIVEAHGGHIWAESGGAGRGSRFIVELPIVEAAKNKKTKNK